MPRKSLIVVDHFYSNPDAVRNKALDMLSHSSDDSASDEPFFPRTIESRFEELIGKRITKWRTGGDRDSYNGFFFISHLNQAFQNFLAVHNDAFVSQLGALVYLSPNAPYDAGTSFWRHKETRISSAPTPTDADRLGVSVSYLDRILYRDRNNRRRWEEIDRVGNVYNRLIIFRAGRLHSAAKYFGGNNRNGRLTHSFSFSTL